MGRLSRAENGVLGGVCAGISKKFGWRSPRNLRLLWAVLSVVTVGAFAIFYILLWMLLPITSKKESYAERMNRRLGRN